MKKAELESLICELLGIAKINPMIKVQITKFTTKHGYSYKDIGRALYYFVTIQGNKPDVSRGIGIIPYVHDAAHAYFEKEKRKQAAQEAAGNKLKRIKDVELPLFRVEPVRKDKGRNKINMEDL